MGKSFFDFEQNIRLRVNKNREVALQSSRINEKVERYLLETLRIILEKCGRPDLLDTTYTIVKELVINGVKANQKRLFFEERGLDLLNPEEYARGLASLREEFSDEMNEVYGREALQRGVYVQILLIYDESGLCVEVVNNTPIVATEERRLREKFERSMGYNDIAEFYMANMDNAEGAGLGIALIIILLKSSGFDPNLFRIYTHTDRTVARVELPFRKDYVSRRGASESS